MKLSKGDKDKKKVGRSEGSDRASDAGSAARKGSGKSARAQSSKGDGEGSASTAEHKAHSSFPPRRIGSFGKAPKHLSENQGQGSGYCAIALVPLPW